ncbi:uncharacterized protein LOC106163174 [Lingula anatina]|uniref:Uncharacterized protein LOC106163174 n=1 Tax=Lingula anatina TaxID=7574 RepID=A0A1S3ID30_LINAN|nr:uncharacterized protein LOC106163174 [Lingula anatina]|eukprot:XP_013396142.1 uncharacterized protein LOC106163174 [Lingula anatina]
MANRIVLVGFLVAVCLGYSSALQCYSCVGAECDDPFDTSNKTPDTCGAINNACSKVKTELSNGQTTVIRSCGILVSEYKCVEASAGGNTVTTCICNGDKCNSSVRVPANALLVAILALFAAFNFGRRY